MLSAQTMQIIKSTVPLLDNAGPAITQHFYQRMFKASPELQDIFNMSNQHSGRQQFALFSAIAAYAKHIDKLDVLTQMVDRIAHKHTSLFVQAEHYDIVGHHLIATLRELAPEAFTPDVEQAWVEAYAFLARIFIGREQQLYRESDEKPGGWKGTRRFIVQRIEQESELVRSFVLTPQDGLAVADYQPGQYLAVKVKPENHDYEEIRQYSLSDKSDRQRYRISVKRETGSRPGLVSNYLHDNIKQGDVLEAFPPAGDFYLRSTEVPLVLISAGVGATPMIAMLESMAQLNTRTPVYYLHACENVSQHSFARRIEQLQQNHPNLQSYTWYKQNEQTINPRHFSGLMELKLIADQLPLADATYYLCGPVEFMKYAKTQLLSLGVQPGQIHYEVFGPHSDL